MVRGKEDRRRTPDVFFFLPRQGRRQSGEEKVRPGMKKSRDQWWNPGKGETSGDICRIKVYEWGLMKDWIVITSFFFIFWEFGTRGKLVTDWPEFVLRVIRYPRETILSDKRNNQINNWYIMYRDLTICVYIYTHIYLYIQCVTSNKNVSWFQ